MSQRETTHSLHRLSPHVVEVPSLRAVVVRSDGARTEAAMGADAIVVGSSGEADLVVDDPRVSRRHCELRVTSEGVLLRDLGSKNGIKIGAVAVRDVVIGLETRVTLGTSEMWIEAAGEPRQLELSPESRFGEAIGNSIAMRVLFRTLARAATVASSHATVLLQGETGTGKELLARAFHEAGPQASGPFVVFDGGNVDATLLSSELFGHERGAFTGAVSARKGLLAEADGGTLFLDEVGEIPLELQSKLLRALESREYCPLGSNRPVRFEARIVAATHRNLKKRVEEGDFRKDLYFRLAVLEVKVPPLRDRRDDIPLLVERMLASRTPPLRLSDFSPEVLAMLRAYDWPGNVRELRNVVERCVVLPDVPLSLGGDEPAAAATGAPGAVAEPWSAGVASLPLSDARKTVEDRFLRWYVRLVLRECGDNVTHAAKRMKIGRQHLSDLKSRLGLSRGDDP